MPLSPAELRFEKPGRALFGYRRTDVDQLLVDATTGYETVWRTRAELDDRVHELSQELAHHRETEAALRDALVSAERAAEERRAQATREAELIVRDAEARARDIVHEAYAERERVRREIERLRGHEQQFRARLRSLVGSTLQGIRDHEAWLAGELGAPGGDVAVTRPSPTPAPVP
jgi:cell division initiation protein